MPNETKKRAGDHAESSEYLHRRKTDREYVIQAHTRLDDHEERLQSHAKLLTGLAQVDEQIISGQKALVLQLSALNENASKIAEILGAWGSVKGFWTTLKFISAASKIIIPIIVFFGAIYAFFRFGHLHVPPDK